MKKHKDLIISTLVCLLPMIAAVILYDKLPEQMPTHWNGHGEVDGYSPKLFACFGLPAILAATNLLVNFLIENDPKRANTTPVMRKMTRILIPAISLLVMTVTIGTGLGKEFNVSLILPIFIGVMFIAIGNYLPKCKQSYTVGIKCPWTLNSEENWNKTHHLGGYLFIIAGFAMILGGFIEEFQVVTIAVIVIVAVVPFVYSFWLYKKGI